MISTSPSNSKRKLRTRKPGRPKKSLAPAAGLTADIKQTMLNTTINLIAERGFDGFALRDVAEAVGVHTALVGYYFKSKMQLEQAAFDFHLDRTETLLRDLQNKLVSSSEPLTRESVKKLFSELGRALDRGDISFKFNRWTLARGGKFAKDLNERLYAPIVQLIAEKLKSALPSLSQGEAEARSLMIFTLAESSSHLGSTYSKSLKLKGTEREISDAFCAVIDSLFLPALIG